MGKGRTYSVEVRHESFGWVQLLSGASLGYAEGYFACHREGPGPRLAIRIMREDGVQVDADNGDTEASIGVVAGFPTAEQYEEAAARCLERAERIREQEAARAERRGRRCE